MEGMPLPTGLNGDGKNVQTLWWAELDRLHSMTRAHPPLVLLFFSSHPPKLKPLLANSTTKLKRQEVTRFTGSFDNYSSWL